MRILSVKEFNEFARKGFFAYLDFVKQLGQVLKDSNQVYKDNINHKIEFDQKIWSDKLLKNLENFFENSKVDFKQQLLSGIGDKLLAQKAERQVRVETKKNYRDLLAENFNSRKAAIKTIERFVQKISLRITNLSSEQKQSKIKNKRTKKFNIKLKKMQSVARIHFKEMKKRLRCSYNTTGLELPKHTYKVKIPLNLLDNLQRGFF